MSTLKGDLRRCLENLPTGLLSHHEAILRIALAVTRHIPNPSDAERAVEAMLAGVAHRPNQPEEIRNAVKGAYHRHNHPELKSNPIKITSVDQGLKKNNIGQAGLFEEFQVRTNLVPIDSADALSKLFEPDESIFVQKQVAEKGVLLPVNDWIAQPDLSQYQFITYNTFPAQATNRSESQVIGRKYLIHETDDPDLSFEQQLGLIKKLENEAELKMIVSSGGKSLHAWFKWTPGNKKAFLELSQSLGGDPRFKLMNQLCRLPWGTRRKEGNLTAEQPIIFWKD